MKHNSRLVKQVKIIFLIGCIAIIFLAFDQNNETRLNTSKENLFGAFGGDEETENAYFGIFEDSIYYPDPDIWNKYELSGDTIIITTNENYVDKLLILKLTTDSLVVMDLRISLELHLNRRKH
ncbi:hypothetical protein ACE1ET_00690 [Saccharicrinis sp. FJH62]|uniref:hypothetical protein n=1 Tax=Saccharicrinis sp. FJH62 TaxID=3344657 RepID=UPI0035D4D8D9